jgi:DNA-binding transcriptional ArsR family regulator
MPALDSPPSRHILSPMVNRSSSLDHAFAALADPTRRAVLARLALGEASVGELTQPHSISLPGFLKHLHALERAGLITHRKEGRVRYCKLNAAPLAEANAWLEQYRSFWELRLDRLGRVLAEEENSWPKPPTPRSRSAARTRRPPSGSSAPGRKRKP